MTTPRTGSWLLAEALQATDLVGEPQEYFGWEGFEASSREFGLDTDASHLRFIEAAMAYGTTEDGIFSAKMHWSQLHRFVTRLRALPGSWPKEAGTILQEFFPDLHCVHLTRADTARQAISYWRAVQLRKWWDLGESRDPSTEPDPDFQQIRWCEEMLIEDERRWRALLDYHNDIPRLEVVYETIIEDLEHTVEEVLDNSKFPTGLSFFLRAGSGAKPTNEPRSGSPFIEPFTTIWPRCPKSGGGLDPPSFPSTTQGAPPGMHPWQRVE